MVDSLLGSHSDLHSGSDFEFGSCSSSATGSHYGSSTMGCFLPATSRSVVDNSQ